MADNDKKTSDAISGCFWVIAVVVGIPMSLLFEDNKPSSSYSPPSNRPEGMSESDYNSVSRRLRQEGLSDQEVDQAARAINEFHQVQQYRKGR